MASYMVVAGGKEYPATPPLISPPTSPYPNTVAGPGIIEASSQNIAVGAPLAGIVRTVYVRVGQTVRKGDPLFALDDEQVSADLQARRAALSVAMARLPLAQAQEKDAFEQLERVRSIGDPRAIAREEVQRRETALLSLRAKTIEARASIDQVRAEVNAQETLLRRHVVAAPIDGEILQLNTRQGEFLTPGVTSPIVMGDTQYLNVRVDIDENEAWRIDDLPQATGYLRGNTKMSIPMKWVRVEPMIVPKRSLTGDSAERVDTRVLQVVMTFPRGSYPVYVGQQLDVYIAARPGLAVPVASSQDGSR